VSPASFFLPFYFGRLLLLPGSVEALFEELTPRRPIFWFLILTIWVIISALFFPRFFEREMMVFSLTRYSDNPEMVVLRPASGNLSQMVYAVGGFATAWATCVYCRMPGGYRAAFQAILAMAIVNIVGGVLDLATTLTGTEFLMDAFRSGTYTLHNDAEVANIKRLVGWMPEASIFSYFSLQILATTFTFYLARINPLITGTLSLILVLMIAASTSTAGYFGLAVFSLAFGLYAVWSFFQHRLRPIAIFSLTALMGIVGGLLLFMFVPKFGDLAERIFLEIVVKKSTSASALERGSWNSTAWNVFLETGGLGAGIGSTRGSSYVLVLLSNVGVIGFVLFAWMIWRTMSISFPAASIPRERAVIWGGRAAVGMTLIVGAALWNVYDLGTSFYCLLGLCMSVDPLRSVVPAIATRKQTVLQKSIALGTPNPAESA